MDINLLKSKLSSLNSAGKKSGTQGEKIDYTKIFWKPQPGKYQIRILPSKFNKSNPFREVFFHYGFAKGPILALNNFGEADPIMEFAAKLRATRDKENYLLAKKLDPKMRVFAPVIVRGEEDKGVRLWEFGNTIYKTLLGFAADEDYGDFTDIAEGRDFTVEADYTEVAGKRVVGCTLRIKPKTTSISESSEYINKWLEEQPDIIALNRKREYNDIKELLAKWLDPEAEEEQQVPAAPAPIPADLIPAPMPGTPPAPQSDWVNDNQVTEQERAAFTLNTNPSDKFDELFN